MSSILPQTTGVPVRVWVAAAALACAVAAPLATAAAARSVVYGSTVRLSGSVPTADAGQPVQIFARPYGEGEFSRVGVVVTKAGGAWSYTARPGLRTIYRAEWEGIATAKVVVYVSPFLDLDVARGVVFARARVSRSLKGKYVVLQARRPGSRWRPFRKLVLGRASTARLRTRLPRGRTHLRLFMPAAQSGPGYTAGYSPVLTLTTGA